MRYSRKQSSRLAVFFLILSAVQTRAWAQADAPASSSGAMMDLFRYEPTGLSLLHPYTRGKVPVVFIHGLWLNPTSWSRMIETLEADPALKGQFQFWTFGYSTGDPIPYSAYMLRRNLDEVRRKLDPERSDPAFDRMVFVGHSMGGLLTKMIASNSADRLWRVITDRPFDDLNGERDDIELFRNGLFFEARPEVRRVVYIATPHRGSRVDRGSIQRVGMRLVRVADPLMAAHRRLIVSNDSSFFREHFRKAIPTSIDELEWGSPILTGLSELSHAPVVKVHSIIAVRPDSPPGKRTDGLVGYESAHIEGVLSEKVISTGHLCQDHPEVIGEVRRILFEHAKP
jgi:pimeloyl-ACP methyl ester carboxylesterase